jgi:hypothetical protein
MGFFVPVGDKPPASKSSRFAVAYFKALGVQISGR